MLSRAGFIFEKIPIKSTETPHKIIIEKQGPIIFYLNQLTESMVKMMQQNVLRIITSVLMMLTQSVIAQQFDKDYSPIQSKGKIPKLFLENAKELTEAETKKLPDDKDKAVKTQFVTANNYFIKDLLMSGDVLINDAISSYLNRVAAEVVEQNPVYAGQSMHIFVTKSPEVNAYAFDKGIIFVNIGLIAQVENEAQLAYILSHEMVHINKKHSVTEYIVNKKSESQHTYDRTSEEEQKLARYRFSKEQEREADIEGLSLIKKTAYSAKAVMGAFDVMQYSYLPFELVEFKKTFFEDKYLKLPDTLILKKVSAIKSNEDYDDSKSSHPNIYKRRLSIEEDISSISDAGRKKYLVSEDEFKKIREMARFELCRTYLLKRDYVNAIYAAYILLQKYPDNFYLKKIVAKGLYNIAINKSSKEYDYKVSSIGSDSYTIEDYEKIEGESQRLYYLMDQLSTKEANVIALSYVYKLTKQNPGDKTLSMLTDSLFSCLVKINSLYPNDFSKLTKEEALKSDSLKLKPGAQVAEAEDAEEESKYSKIKKLKIIQTIEDNVSDNEQFIKYAFVELMKDDDFMNRFRKMTKGADTDPGTNDNIRTTSKKKKVVNTNEFLGIDKVLFVDPYYQKLLIKNGEKEIQYYTSEEKQSKLMTIQEKCADRLGLQYIRLSTKSLSENDIETYNDLALINDWITERFKHGNSNENIECSEAMNGFIAKRGVKYLALNGVQNNNKKTNSYLFLLFDLESGDVKQFEIKNNRAKDSNDLLTMYVYNSLFHVATKPKK